MIAQHSHTVQSLFHLIMLIIVCSCTKTHDFTRAIIHFFRAAKNFGFCKNTWSISCKFVLDTVDVFYTVLINPSPPARIAKHRLRNGMTSSDCPSLGTDQGLSTQNGTVLRVRANNNSDGNRKLGGVGRKKCFKICCSAC